MACVIHGRHGNRPTCEELVTSVDFRLQYQTPFDDVVHDFILILSTQFLIKICMNLCSDEAFDHCSICCLEK